MGDFRLALRAMRQRPGFAVTVVSMLAAGIGVNTIAFSVVSAALLEPLPYRDPARLVTVLYHGANPVSPADFLDWKRQGRSFQQMAAAAAWSAVLAGREGGERIQGLQLTEGFFDMLGVAPLRGRTFLPADKDHVVVLSYPLWQRVFGGDAGAIGRTLKLSGAPYTVIGVMPPRFRFAPFWVTQAELWTPLALDSQAGNRAAQFLRVFARLRPGVALAQAQAEIDTICARLQAAYPETNAGLSARVDSLREKAVGNVRPALLVLFGAVAFVLLLAVSNIASLTLARSLERRREVAIRRALGAGGTRIVRQLLTECVILSTAGGLLGLLLAGWGIASLKVFIGIDRLPAIETAGIDARVLCFAAAVSLLTGVMFGLAPALEALRADLNGALKEGGRAATESGRAARLRGALVIAQVAICVVLLAGAGLLLRSFVLLRAVDPGFDPRGVLTLAVSLSGREDLAGPRRETFYRRVVEDVRRLPGVESASMVNHLPIGGDVWGSRIFAEGHAIPEPRDYLHAVYRVCRAGYFHTMRIPILKGRDFTDRDDTHSPRVVIVNEALANALWPSDDPIGRRIATGDPRDNPEWLTIVGVVRNLKQQSWTEPSRTEFYVPFQQDAAFLSSVHPARASMTLVVRTAGRPLALAGAVRHTISSLDREVAVSQIRSLDQVIAGALWDARFHLFVLGGFALFAVLLAAAGIYGVVSYSVARRTHEIGVRIALGATGGNILRMVLRQGLALVLAGIAIGLAAAWLLTRSLSTLLYRVSTADPLTFAAAPIALAATALLAACVPARRAAAVAPVVALRNE